MSAARPYEKDGQDRSLVQLGCGAGGQRTTYLEGAGGFSRVPTCFELEMTEKLCLELLSPILNTVLLVESNFGRWKGRKSMSTSVRAMDAAWVIPWIRKMPGLGKMQNLGYSFLYDLLAGLYIGESVCCETEFKFMAVCHECEHFQRSSNRHNSSHPGRARVSAEVRVGWIVCCKLAS